MSAGALLYVGRFWGPLFTDEPPVVIFGPGPHIDGLGPPGAAVFALSLEDGFEVEFMWLTSVFRSQDGHERRSSRGAQPKVNYRGSAYMIGDRVRWARGQLARYAALGRPFQVALPHEELVLAGAGGTANVVDVGDTSDSDWLQVLGQRVVVVDADLDEYIDAVVQDSNADTVTLDEDVSSVARRGCSIMPTAAVYLDAQQDFERIPNDLDSEDEDAREKWNIRGRGITFSYSGVSVDPDHSSYMGRGVSLTMHGPANSFSADSLRPVWDRGIDIEGASESLQTSTQLVDLDGVPSVTSDGEVEDWGRSAAITRPIGPEFQWLKKFLAYARGSFRSWWLPTDRPDLMPVELQDGSETTFAQLDLSLPLAVSGALQSIVLQAKVAGPAGNAITVTFRETPVDDHGRLVESGNSMTVFFVGDLTTNTDIMSVLATSTLVDVVHGPEQDGDVLAAVDDEFVNAHLHGGLGAVAQRLVVKGPSGEDGDFFAWWPTRRQNVKLLCDDDSVVFAVVVSADDNGDGTLTLGLDQAVGPDVTEVVLASWLELCRFEKDALVVKFRGSQFTFKETCRVVQQ